MLNRRNFLMYSGALTLLPLANRFARAVPALTGEQRFFILVRVYGGMDATLGLDAWQTPESAPPDPKDMFIEYKDADLVDIGGDFKLGPAARPLEPHKGSFSVINGVFMSQVDNGHIASQFYLSNGTTASLAPTLPVEIALSTREGDFGILTNSALNMGNRAALSSNLSDLRDLPNKADVSDILEIIKGVKDTPYFEAIKRVLSSRPALQTFINNLQSFGPLDKITDAQVMAAAFMSEVATTAQYDITKFNLDTHASHPANHLAQQMGVWTEVADMFTLFKGIPYGNQGASLFDHTTFMVMTEFSRTPALNSANGKDHNPLTNSVLLAGGGVRGGLITGASRLVTSKESLGGNPYHIAYPIDYATCEVQRTRTANAGMIFPENVAQTVAQIMQVDPGLFHSLPAGTKPLSVLIKS
jgi:uncharacterized protein (DUF1501 family)